jgi:hypothetical protein
MTRRFMGRNVQCLGGGRNVMAFETVGSWFDPLKCHVLFLFVRLEFTPTKGHPFISFVYVWQLERLPPYLHRTIVTRRNVVNCFRRVRKIAKSYW